MLSLPVKNRTPGPLPKGAREPLFSNVQHVSGNFYDTSTGTKTLDISLSQTVKGFAAGMYAIEIRGVWAYNNSNSILMDQSAAQLTTAGSLRLTGYYPEAYRQYGWSAAVYDINPRAAASVERGATLCSGASTLITLAAPVDMAKALLMAAPVGVPYINNNRIQGGMKSWEMYSSTQIRAMVIGTTAYRLFWNVLTLK